jgi:hypothetical protein
MNDNNMTLPELEKAAKKHQHTITKSQMSNYHYARSLGFNSYEASVLRSRTKDNIRQLAIEKGLFKEDGQQQTRGSRQ